VSTNHENVSQFDITILRLTFISIFFEVSTLMVYFSQKLEHPRFVQKKFSRKRDTVQGEKAGHSSAPASPGRGGRGGANCQKQPRSHMYLWPSLIQSAV
jgi:hypothetical protein